jgi:hypothetical protein
MTANATLPSPLGRAVNGLIALALAVYVLATYWPTLQLFDLSRADLDYEGEWIGGHAKEITAVTPGGAADRARLKPGDVLEFDPDKNDDWVLASYRNMPEGFSATLPVRRADGTRSVVAITPERAAYLPRTYDRLALLAHLCALAVGVTFGLIVVTVYPSLMSWCVLFSMLSTGPVLPWRASFFAFDAGHGTTFALGAALLEPLIGAMVPFALTFPSNTLARVSWWKRLLGLAIWLTWTGIWLGANMLVPFEHDASPKWVNVSWAATSLAVAVAAIAVHASAYRRADGASRARLKWAMLGMSAVLASMLVVIPFLILPFWLGSTLSGAGLSNGHWALALSFGFFWPLALGYAIFRQRVVDVQFAVSRTLVFGAMTTLVLAALAAVHWIFGKLIEQSHFAIWIEGLAMIGLGLALHRGTHAINGLVDRVLFRKHHAAEERLRRVTAALPYATERQSLAEALVLEPARNLNLASAALFFRDSGDGPLRRVLTHGWSDEHVASLTADSLLVRYLQANHEPLTLDDAQLLPAGTPGGAGLPVLAIPIMNQHELAAVVLYGAHTNYTLLDPDEIELLHALAKAAATSHQQVRIAVLMREKAAAEREAELLARENAVEKEKSRQLEASSAELRAMLAKQLAGAGTS